MGGESTIVGGGTFPGLRYATWPLISIGVEDGGVRVGSRFWPVLLFGFLDVDRSLVELRRAERAVLIPWSSIRSAVLRRPNALTLTMTDGWRFGFGSSGSLERFVEDVRARLSGRPQDVGDA